MKLHQVHVHEDFWYNGQLWRKIARQQACGIGEDNRGKLLRLSSHTDVEAA